MSKVTLPRETWENLVRFLEQAYDESCSGTYASKGEYAYRMFAWGSCDNLEKALRITEEVGRD